MGLTFGQIIILGFLAYLLLIVIHLIRGQLLIKSLNEEEYKRNILDVKGLDIRGEKGLGKALVIFKTFLMLFFLLPFYLVFEALGLLKE